MCFWIIFWFQNVEIENSSKMDNFELTNQKLFSENQKQEEG